MSASVPSTAPVGFVGLGTMGAPIASRLLGAAPGLVVHNRDRSKAEPLLAAGAKWAESPRELGRASRGGIVFVMLTDAKAVRSVVFGRSGLAAGADPSTLLVNLSTIAPEESRALAERLARRGVHYLEAPVGGSREAAARGELLVLAGGSDEDLARARPLLERFARRIEHLGPVGLGAAMKLVNNLVTVGTVALDAEAIAFAEALGLERARTVDLLLAGGGGSRMLEGKREAFVQGEYPVQFKLTLAEKDLGLIGRAAREAGVRAPLSREVRRLTTEAVRAGDGERDLAVVLEAARRRRAGSSAVPAADPAPSGPAPSP
jgi:3-hydroxyisobutyrate dehydrogenase-like beta-hydroxyacid dehydrogenase